MPIAVTCPGCKASFSVSEKFAGKQGPCPKCKVVITIPKLDAAKKQEEVKIHAPDEMQKGATKTATGRPIFNPIERRDLKLNPYVAGGIVVGIIAVFIAAWLVGGLVQAPDRLSAELQLNPEAKAAYDRALLWDYIWRAAALILVGAPIVWVGYIVLRDDELEPHRGNSLWIRCGICLAVYIGIWAAYAAIPADYTSSGYMWIVLGPPIFLAGFVTAYFCFDFDPVSAATHFLFFALVTLMLGWTAGLDMPWHDDQQEVKVSTSDPLFTEDGQPLNDAARKLLEEQGGTPTATATGSP